MSVVSDKKKLGALRLKVRDLTQRILKFGQLADNLRWTEEQLRALGNPPGPLHYDDGDFPFIDSLRRVYPNLYKRVELLKLEVKTSLDSINNISPLGYNFKIYDRLNQEYEELFKEFDYLLGSENTMQEISRKLNSFVDNFLDDPNSELSIPSKGIKVIDTPKVLELTKKILPATEKHGFKYTESFERSEIAIAVLHSKLINEKLTKRLLKKPERDPNNGLAPYFGGGSAWLSNAIQNKKLYLFVIINKSQGNKDMDMDKIDAKDVNNMVIRILGFTVTSRKKQHGCIYVEWFYLFTKYRQFGLGPLIVDNIFPTDRCIHLYSLSGAYGFWRRQGFRRITTLVRKQFRERQQDPRLLNVTKYKDPVYGKVTNKTVELIRLSKSLLSSSSSSLSSAPLSLSTLTSIPKGPFKETLIETDKFSLLKKVEKIGNWIADTYRPIVKKIKNDMEGLGALRDKLYFIGMDQKNEKLYYDFRILDKAEQISNLYKKTIEKAELFLNRFSGIRDEIDNEPMKVKDVKKVSKYNLLIEDYYTLNAMFYNLTEQSNIAIELLNQIITIINLYVTSGDIHERDPAMEVKALDRLMEFSTKIGLENLVVAHSHGMSDAYWKKFLDDLEVERKNGFMKEISPFTNEEIEEYWDGDNDKEFVLLFSGWKMTDVTKTENINSISFFKKKHSKEYNIRLLGFALLSKPDDNSCINLNWFHIFKKYQSKALERIFMDAIIPPIRCIEIINFKNIAENHPSIDDVWTEMGFKGHFDSLSDYDVRFSHLIKESGNRRFLTLTRPADWSNFKKIYRRPVTFL